MTAGPYPSFKVWGEKYSFVGEDLFLLYVKKYFSGHKKIGELPRKSPRCYGLAWKRNLGRVAVCIRLDTATFGHLMSNVLHGEIASFVKPDNKPWHYDFDVGTMRWQRDPESDDQPHEGVYSCTLSWNQARSWNKRTAQMCGCPFAALETLRYYEVQKTYTSCFWFIPLITNRKSKVATYTITFLFPRRRDIDKQYFNQALKVVKRKNRLKTAQRFHR